MEKDLGVLVDNKLNISQSTLAAKMAKCILADWQEDSQGSDPLSLSSTCKTASGDCVQWMKNNDKLDQVQRMATKTVRWLGNTT